MAISQHQQRVHTGQVLVALTLAYNLLEAVVALSTAWRDRSLSLEAFGLDSIIEIGLGAVLLWRLRVEATGGTGERIAEAERRANWWAGMAFYALAAVIVAETVWTLTGPLESTPSLLGIGLATASVLIMPVLATAKARVGRQIGSKALQAEASCTWVCFYMSLTLLAGLVLGRWGGWQWADPLAALGIVWWVVREGREAFAEARGESCCGCHGDS